MNCPTCGKKMAHFKNADGSYDKYVCLHLILHAELGDKKENRGGKRKGAGRKPRKREENNE